MLEDAGGSTIKHIYITIVNLMTIAPRNPFLNNEVLSLHCRMWMR